MYVCKRYGTDPSSRYGTGVWNRCGPGPCSGFYNLTCTPIIYIYIYIYHVLICIIHLTTMHGRFHPKLFFVKHIAGSEPRHHCDPRG